MFTSFLNTILPQKCVGCGAYDTPLCDVCVHSSLTYQRSVFTEERSGIISITRLGSYHHSVWKQAISAMKFQGTQQIAERCGEWLARMIVTDEAGWLPFLNQHHSELLVTAIPLHPRRFRERGYNQAEVIAQRCATRLSLPFLPLLQRTRYTTPQTLVTGEERATNVAQIFAPVQQRVTFSIAPQILLVDDVVTTGSTILNAAAALVAFQPAAIHVLTIATATDIMHLTKKEL